MDSNDAITLYGLLDYLYNRFAVTYLMCFLGVMIGQSLRIFSNGLKKIKPASAFNIAMQGALVTVIMCALQDFINIKSMNVYVLCCTFIGLWSPLVIKLITNLTVVKKLIVNITKRLKDPVMAAVGETIDQMDENELSDNNKKEIQDTNSKEHGDGT